MRLNRPVLIRQLPAWFSVTDVHNNFFRDMQRFFTEDHPRIVFDLSRVEQMDSAGIELLIECMAECMKRDGDLKLSSLSPHADTVLELTRAKSLFEIYETSSDAVESFTGFKPHSRNNPVKLGCIWRS